MAPIYFCMVAKGDVPIYELKLHPTSANNKKEELNQFIVHSALDAVDDKVWSNTNLYLKVVDTFNDTTISAFVSAGHTKFMLLHDHRVDESAVKSFLHDVHELYVKVLMNPFYVKNTAINDRAYDERVYALAEKYLVR